MDSANLPVSIPRGRGRRVVTLYEAQIRRLATGRVYRRAAVMDFIRLVHEAAVQPPPPSEQHPEPPVVHPNVARLQQELERLRSLAASADATDTDLQTAHYFELLLALAQRNTQR